MKLDDLDVGQAMIVWQGIPTRRRYDAVVSKIGRKYVTLEVWRGVGRTDKIEFDIETQKERGADGSYAAFFRTPAEQDLTDRGRDVRDRLRFYGLLPEYTGPATRRKLTLEQMEAVVELLDQLVGRDLEDEAVPGEGS